MEPVPDPITETLAGIDRTVEHVGLHGGRLRAATERLRVELTDDPASHWRAIAIRRSALEFVCDHLEAAPAAERPAHFDRTHLDLADGMLRRVLDTVPSPPPEHVPPTLTLDHWWWRRPAGPERQELVLPALLRQLREAREHPGLSVPLLRALESLLDIWRGPTRVPLLSGELQAFVAEADAALAAAGDQVRTYAWEALRLAADPGGVHRWHEACLRRSVLQVLVDHHHELPLSITELEELDVLLRDACDRLGPLHHDDVPAGLPEHHWWWRGPALPGSVPPPDAAVAELDGPPAGIWDLERNGGARDWYEPFRDAFPWLTVTSVTTEYRRWTRACGVPLVEWLERPDPSETLSAELAAGIAWGTDAQEIVLGAAAELRLEGESLRLLVRPDAFTDEAGARNRRRLRDGLRVWEASTGGEITAWHGCRERTAPIVERHGFGDG